MAAAFEIAFGVLALFSILGIAPAHGQAANENKDLKGNVSAKSAPQKEEQPKLSNGVPASGEPARRSITLPAPPKFAARFNPATLTLEEIQGRFPECKDPDSAFGERAAELEALLKECADPRATAPDLDLIIARIIVGEHYTDGGVLHGAGTRLIAQAKTNYEIRLGADIRILEEAMKSMADKIGSKAKSKSKR